MALAPSFPLLGVPSAAIIARSRLTWSVGSRPMVTFARAPFTLATACATPLPPYRDLSPSRNSTASWAPVLAPEGTAARPSVPSARITSTSTVGLPRLSRISRPRTFAIGVVAWLMFVLEAPVIRRMIHQYADGMALTDPGPDRDGHVRRLTSEILPNAPRTGQGRGRPADRTTGRPRDDPAVNDRPSRLFRAQQAAVHYSPWPDWLGVMVVETWSLGSNGLSI